MEVVWVLTGIFKLVMYSALGVGSLILLRYIIKTNKNDNELNKQVVRMQKLNDAIEVRLGNMSSEEWDNKWK